MGFWKRGERAEIARICNISSSYLGDILYRRRTVSLELAARLTGATCAVKGWKNIDELVPFGAFCNNKYTNHPAFFGKPK